MLIKLKIYFIIGWKQSLWCVLESWKAWRKNNTFLGDSAGATSWKTKTQEKAWLSGVFSFPYLAAPFWHGANLQKGFSQDLLDARGREREVAGKTAGQWMFHYTWCCFPPKALSKVSEQREPRPELFKPLVTTWSKAALHFLIFALEWEPLHRSCVCEHSGAFYFDLISPCMFKSVLLPKKGMWYGQKRSNIFRMINWQSKANIIVRDTATVNILKVNKLQMIWWDYCSQSGFCSCKNPSRCKMEPGNVLIYVVICVHGEL